MSKLHKLSNGVSIRGAQMGRPSLYPKDRFEKIRLSIYRLRWVDGDYDQKGAYWGNSGDFIYCAYGIDSTGEEVEIFVRAKTRSAAKDWIREELDNCWFVN